MDLATKKMQMSAKKACFQFAEVQLFFCKDTTFLNNQKIIENQLPLTSTFAKVQYIIVKTNRYEFHC